MTYKSNIASHIKNHFQKSLSVLQDTLNSCSEDIIDASELLVHSVKEGNKILIAGNGGSAADAQHIAAELIIRLNKEIDRPAIPAIALTVDTSILTAGGNDIGFENVFARQVQGLGNEGDIFILISTSGNSRNLIKAAEMARNRGLKTIGLLGSNGGELKNYCDRSIIIPGKETQHIQEAHLVVYHILCENVETICYGS